HRPPTSTLFPYTTLFRSIIKGRTRQTDKFLKANGRLPVDAFELEGTPRVPRMLLLAACDGQQAIIERSESEPARALLRLQLPTRDRKSTRLNSSHLGISY